MLELEEAQRLLLARVHSLPEETVPLPKAGGRILSRDVTAPIHLPSFDNSAMDGFAVRAEDTVHACKEKPAVLRLLGRTPAGEQMGPALEPGTCVRVFTGSALPPATTAVVMQEDSESDPGNPDLIRIFDEVKPWENLRLRGEDVKEGEQVLRTGERLNAQKLALASALGLAQLEVHRRPVVGLMATGNELAEPGRELLAGRIFESNRVCLASMIESAGGFPKIYSIVPDRLEATRAALENALRDCDAVVSTGGVSVGELDYIKMAFEELGGQLVFWRVALKPGKPFVFGEWKNKLFFGLPGNPVSAFVTFVLLVRPVVLRFQGASECGPFELSGRLVEPLSNRGDRRHFMRVYLDGKGNVRETGTQASHMLASLAKANGLVDVPSRSTISAGTAVPVIYTG